MSDNAWLMALSAVASTGVITQCYPAWAPAGVAPAAAARGDLIRKPMTCSLHSITISPDGTNGGLLEIWDVDGAEGGADVSSATAITNAEMTSLISRGLAKKIFEIDFAGTVGSGPSPYAGLYRAMSKGIAMRFSNAGPTGACKANLVVGGIGYLLVSSAGV